MYESRTWRVRPGEPFTFGRAPACSAVLPAGDRGVSRHAGSFGYHGGCWWLHNDSSSAMLCVLGDRGFRADLPPGLQVPLQQWHAKVTVGGVLGSYTLRLRLPGLDDAPDLAGQAAAAAGTGEGAVTSPRPIRKESSSAIDTHSSSAEPGAALHHHHHATGPSPDLVQPPANDREFLLTSAEGRTEPSAHFPRVH